MVELIGRGELELLLLQLIDPARLRFSLLACLLAEVHEEHSEAIRNRLRAISIDEAHNLMKNSNNYN
jgi:hypothetical protein